MDPTLTSLVVGVVGLSIGAVLSFGRRTSSRSVEREHALARERGLGDAELHQLEHLTRFRPDATLADLLISPLRFDQAAAAYVTDLRRQNLGPSPYFAIVIELTRLRRRVHPPGNVLRALVSTRDLPEGIDVVLAANGSTADGMVWSVNEDHFDLRVEDAGMLSALRAGGAVTVELSRPGQGVYEFSAAVRATTPLPKPVLRFEHTDALTRTNRREFVRESASVPLIVTPHGQREPLAAVLRDLSGGGLSFSVDESLPAGERVRVMLPLGDAEAPPRFLEATILRTEVEPETGRLRAIGQWTRLDSDSREAIVRFVFALQRRRVRTARAAAAGTRPARILTLVPNPD